MLLHQKINDSSGNKAALENNWMCCWKDDKDFLKHSAGSESFGSVMDSLLAAGFSFFPF